MLHIDAMRQDREAIALLTDTLEQAAAIKGQRARYLARKMLAMDLTAHESFLTRVEEVYGAVTRERGGWFG